MEYRRRLPWLDAREPDHLAPLFRFIGDVFAKIGTRARKQHSPAEFAESCSELRVGERCVDLVVKLVDNLNRRGAGRAKANPCARFVAWQEFGHSGDVRHDIQTCRSGYGQGAQPTSPNMWKRGRNNVEHDLHLTGEQIG